MARKDESRLLAGILVPSFPQYIHEFGRRPPWNSQQLGHPRRLLVRRTLRQPGPFSDYFLKHRLPNSDDFPKWREDPKPAHNYVREIHFAAQAGKGAATRDSLRVSLLEPVLSEAGFQLEAGGASADLAEPDFRLTSGGRRRRFASHTLGTGSTIRASLPHRTIELENI